MSNARPLSVIRSVEFLCESIIVIYDLTTKVIATKTLSIFYIVHRSTILRVCYLAKTLKILHAFAPCLMFVIVNYCCGPHKNEK
jgi:hypothetical protein